MAVTNYSTFYTPPSPLPSGPTGYIIKQEPSNLATFVTKINATATRVMYLSKDANGVPNAVTGTYFEPDAAWGGIGPRPLIGYAPGTYGLGDQCAPSRLFNQVLYCGGQKDFFASWQSANVADKVAQGMAVFVTDYENVGTSFATKKNNTFMNRKASAQALLDGVKAAHNLAGTTLTESSKTVLWGYSQGGHAVGAAAELLATYAPELTTIVGAYCGSPIANIFDLVQNLDKNLLTGTVGYLLNGFKVAYPDNITAITASLTALGQTLVTNSQRMCLVEAGMTFGFQPLSNYFVDCTTFDDLVRLINTEPYHTMISDQNLGTVEPSIPVMLATNQNDPLVTYKTVCQLAQKWCGLGADVQFYTSTAAIPQLGLQKTNLIHFVSAQVDDEVSLDWMKDRINGVATSPNCAVIGHYHTVDATIPMVSELTANASVS